MSIYVERNLCTILYIGVFSGRYFDYSYVSSYAGPNFLSSFPFIFTPSCKV